MRKQRFKRHSKRAQSLGNVVSTEGVVPCSMLASIGQTNSMTDWSWTKRDGSWGRSVLLIRQKVSPSWMSGLRRLCTESPFNGGLSVQVAVLHTQSALVLLQGLATQQRFVWKRSRQNHRM